MRDLIFVFFILLILGMGFRRPFIWVLAYIYVDIVAPQRLSYYLFSSVQLSLIIFFLAFASWLLFDNKKYFSISARQAAVLMLLFYCGITTYLFADFPEAAVVKWDWVYKGMIFAIFLPLTLYTRLRIEAVLLTMLFSVSAIVITGGIKTVLSGGGYGVLKLLVSENFGLYEGSIISAAAICIIPLILWSIKYNSIFAEKKLFRLFGYCLIFACLMIPVGTQARTGLICIGVLAVLNLRFVRYRVLYIAMAGLALVIAVPFLPQNYMARMQTIENYQADESASTRIAVWKWTWDYAKRNPLGGGFEMYRQNKVNYQTVSKNSEGGLTEVKRDEVVDKARAYHSAYFEMLGEQGFPGLFLWLSIHIGCIIRMEMLRSKYQRSEKPEEQWIAPLAMAFVNAQIIFMVGALFVGIAFQTFFFLLVSLQIGLSTYVRQQEKRNLKARNKKQTAMPKAQGA